MKPLDSTHMAIPRFIYFAGVDGSGKSTYIELLSRDLRRRGLKVRTVWLRFNYALTRPVLLFCRLGGLTRRPIRGGREISVHDFYKRPAVGKLVQFLHLVDTCISYLVKVYLPLNFTSTYILCDKFSYDILADFMVENRDLRMAKGAIAKCLIRLIPKGAGIVYLTASKDDIVGRKPSVLDDDDDFDVKYAAYSRIADNLSFRTFNNSADMHSVYLEILHYLEPNGFGSVARSS